MVFKVVENTFGSVSWGCFVEFKELVSFHLAIIIAVIGRKQFFDAFVFRWDGLIRCTKDESGCWLRSHHAIRIWVQIIPLVKDIISLFNKFAVFNQWHLCNIVLNLVFVHGDDIVVLQAKLT